MLSILSLFLFAGSVVAFVLYVKKEIKRYDEMVEEFKQLNIFADRTLSNYYKLAGQLDIVLHDLQQVKTRLTWSKKREKKVVKHIKKHDRN